MMAKYKMPTVPEFLKKKTIYSRKEKKEPEWVYLEKEMLANIENKPYNEIVHEWLVYLKELRYYFYCEGKRKETRLLNEVGPAWYVELSNCQREVLAHLKDNIHQDLLEDIPRRIRKALSDLGVTLKIPKKVLIQTMSESVEDPGIFIWNLYKAIYNASPSILRKRYDMNAMIMMSSLVFIDLDECVERLEKLTYFEKIPSIKLPKPKKKYYQPNVRYGEYLQKSYIPFYTSHKEKREEKPSPLGNRVRLRTTKSYEALIQDEKFLEKRKERNMHKKEEERICTYKFWEPPSNLRNTNPKMAALAEKLKMIKMKAQPKYKAPFKHIQYLVAGVSFTGGKPSYILANVGMLPTGYMAINGGVCVKGGSAVTQISGFWLYPKIVKEICDLTCDCLAKWEGSVMEYLKNSKCKCGHRYDFNHEGKALEKYFYPPTRHGKFWIDEPKIYQLDPMEDFIKDTFREALKSGATTPKSDEPTISASGLKEYELLAALFADLSDTPLLIPHLPNANFLNNLQEWVRHRVKGSINPKDHKRMLLVSQRRWLDLKHVDHRARAFLIPFTQKQLKHMNWSHRQLVQKLFNVLLDNFVSRNRLKQVEQTRMWWPTTKYDAYPNKPFLQRSRLRRHSRPDYYENLHTLSNVYMQIQTARGLRTSNEDPLRRAL